MKLIAILLKDIRIYHISELTPDISITTTVAITLTIKCYPQNTYPDRLSIKELEIKVLSTFSIWISVITHDTLFCLSSWKKKINRLKMVSFQMKKCGFCLVGFIVSETIIKNRNRELEVAGFILSHPHIFRAARAIRFVVRWSTWDTHTIRTWLLIGVKKCGNT